MKRYTGADIKGKPGSSARTDLENFTECDWVNIKGELGTKGALNIVLRLWHTYLGESGAQWAANDFGDRVKDKNCSVIPGVRADGQCLLPAHSTPVDMEAVIRMGNLVIAIACVDGRPNVCTGKGPGASAGELAQVVLPKL